MAAAAILNLQKLLYFWTVWPIFMKFESQVGPVTYINLGLPEHAK
jgi:hypothetical protein